MVIEWHSTLIEEEYNQTANEVLHHPSLALKEEKIDDTMYLEDCLRKFHEVEDLGPQDNIYCGQCKTHMEHFKKLEIFRPPVILIVYLKRFKFT